MIEPYTPEWFKLRQGRFTASEAWKLMVKPKSKKDFISKTAETYILQCVWEKITGTTKQGVDNFATEWGREHESLSKKWYAKLSGNVLTGSFMKIHHKQEMLCATPDDSIGAIGLLEVKCPANGENHLKHCFITTDEYFKENHTEYYWQCVSQMTVFEASWCDFVSFDPRLNTDLGFFSYRLAYNESESKALLESVEKATEVFNSYYELFSKGKA